MSAEIMERASELAEAIAESGELEAMRQAEVIMSNDPEAVKILTEFQQKQRSFYEKQMRGEQLSDQEKQEIEEIEGRMSGNKFIKAYIDASEKFEHLMRSVNLVITKAISGGNSCGCGSECGPDCESDCDSGCCN